MSNEAPAIVMTRNVIPALLFSVLAITISGCNSGGVSKSDLDELESEILAIIGSAEASDSSFCKAVGFGSKPCGGHWQYLVYSSESIDESELLDLVSEYNELDAQRNQELGIGSDCQFVTEPGLSLTDGVCTATAD